MTAYDQDLYDALSRLRLELARKETRPAFTVFHNRALIQMAEVFPGNKETFLKIRGVGLFKWEKYGPLFLDLIIAHCSEKGIPHGEIAQKTKKIVKKEIKVIASELDPLLERVLDYYQKCGGNRSHSPKNLVMNLASNVGKLLDFFKWISEDQSYCLDGKKLDEMHDEMGDTFMVLMYLCSKLGLDPLDATRKKLSINNSNF